MDIVWSYDSTHGKLDRILRSLEQLSRKVDDMAVSEADFDAALAAYVADVDAGVQALVAKAQTVAPEADFTAELATITDAKTDLDSTLAAANTAAPVASPVTPDEGPAVVSAITDNAPTGPNPPDSLEQAALDGAAADAQTVADNTPAPDPAVSAPVSVDGETIDAPGPDGQPIPTLVSGPQTSGIVADDGTDGADGSVAPPAPDAVDGESEASAPAPDAA